MNRGADKLWPRRQFLAAAASGMVAAPYVITSTALGGAGRPPASNRVVLGYIGTGPRGQLNIREELSCPQAQVIAVCDVWKHVRDQAKTLVDGHYGNTDCKAYNDFREVLARNDIDAVGIATTDHWHVPISVLAAKAGKDVCVEKPLGVSVAEDLLCREVMKRYNRVFQYGTEARASPTCRLGAELVRNGRIGRISGDPRRGERTRRGGSRKPLPVPGTLDYDLSARPGTVAALFRLPQFRRWVVPRLRLRPGFIAGWGAHPLDLLQWSFDTHMQGNWEVEGTGVIPTEGCNDAVIDWDVRVRFASGVTMNYWATGVPKDEHPQLAKLGNYAQLIGDEGWVAVYYASMACDPPSLAQLPPGPIRLPVGQGQERNFIECVQSRQTPMSNIDDAVHSDIISHISDIAIRSRRKIVWDPVEEEIVGDAEASRRLARAVREPWRF